jgi:hypothetical protein
MRKNNVTLNYRLQQKSKSEFHIKLSFLNCRQHFKYSSGLAGELRYKNRVATVLHFTALECC